MASSSGSVFIIMLCVFASFSSLGFSCDIEKRRWPNARIPFKIKGTLSPLQLVNISLAMDEIQNQSCIQFEPLYGDGVFYMGILDTSRDPEFPAACYAENIGRNVSIREQKMHLGNSSCFQVGVIMHELLHVIGLYHEQARCDRDSFVKINWENVENTTAAKENFEIKENEPIGPYDYLSLMHYPRHLFAIDPALDTITPLNDRVNATGRLDGLSPCDIYKINKMYSCENQDINLLQQQCEKYVNSSWGGEPKDPSFCKLP